MNDKKHTDYDADPFYNSVTEKHGRDLIKNGRTEPLKYPSNSLPEPEGEQSLKEMAEMCFTVSESQ